MIFWAYGIILSPSMYPFSHAIEQHTDNVQHAFSSDRGTTLHLALPALEALHKAWTTRPMSPTRGTRLKADFARCL